ncbi:fatty acid desaturase CarF family protein [Aureliella helgolandensis]|uniref:Kua-ubiquitin conjugating enzyme hybrid localization domain protein n=1 Tax=Aureliella helgolandensis TaxID=2527968 RepID=A0A518GDP3_9BACT|nr:fatty acid desaturase CarF family protein [Aureliella helgolandensis]QDV26726.1 Kua-ubiquitin conjugating enzyme hybrid localization domain protein [Aureliella helgolandensis]
MFYLLGWIVASYLAADLLAGFWHWLEDRYFEETWPIVGKYIAKPNSLHHEQPTAFLFQSYWKRNWTTILPAAVAFACSLWHPIALVFVFVSQANEIHAWAHNKGKVSPLIAAIQETGILQSPKHHAEHHRSPFAIRYCVMSDLLNPILDYFQFWRKLEGLLETATGIRPKPE